jgi:hypothetical protein
MKFDNKVASEVTKLIKGKKVRIVSSLSGHGYGPIGSVILVKTTTVYNHGGCQAITMNGKGWINILDIELIALTKEELESELKELKDQQTLIENKLKYIKATKSESFDETEFKIYNTLQLLKGSKSDLDKAKAIAQLING